MKTIDKKFDAVKFMRSQRDKLSEELIILPKEKILEYFKKSRSKSQIKPMREVKTVDQINQSEMY